MGARRAATPSKTRLFRAEKEGIWFVPRKLRCREKRRIYFMNSEIFFFVFPIFLTITKEGKKRQEKRRPTAAARVRGQPGELRRPRHGAGRGAGGGAAGQQLPTPDG